MLSISNEISDCINMFSSIVSKLYHNCNNRIVINKNLNIDRTTIYNFNDYKILSIKFRYKLSLINYLKYILERLELSKEIILIAIVYFNKIINKLDTINKNINNKLNLHYICLCLILISHKFNDDIVYNIKEISQYICVDYKILIIFEKYLLELLDYNLTVDYSDICNLNHID